MLQDFSLIDKLLTHANEISMRLIIFNQFLLIVVSFIII